MRLPLPLVASVLVLGLTACGGKEVVRGSNDPSIDSHAVSTGLDKDDIQRALSETLNHMRSAPIMNEWRSTHPPPTVAVFPFRHNTSEHIDSMLDAMLSETETWLVDAGTVSVVARDRQGEMMKEVEVQQTAAFNPAKAAQLGRQIGAKYVITGKVSAADERSEDMRRVQYMLFFQVIEAETSIIKWQRKAYITKAIK